MLEEDKNRKESVTEKSLEDGDYRNRATDESVSVFPRHQVLTGPTGNVSMQTTSIASSAASSNGMCKCKRSSYSRSSFFKNI
jgi:hypothetical protein